jgi:hypothetical protein
MPKKKKEEEIQNNKEEMTSGSEKKTKKTHEEVSPEESLEYEDTPEELAAAKALLEEMGETPILEVIEDKDVSQKIEEEQASEQVPDHEDTPEEIAAAKAFLEEMGETDKITEWFGEETPKTMINDDPLEPIQGMVYLKQTLAYIEIRVEDEAFVFNEQAQIFAPQAIAENPDEKEFVYPIYDFGDRLIASKATESLFAGQSMIKMFYTIDKMISIWYEKIKQKDEEERGKKGKGGTGEVKIYLDGFDLCLRKAFEVIINLSDNWVVMNYDPGEWANRYLEILQKLNNQGFAYPPPAPRDYYRHGTNVKKPKPSFSS